MIPLDLLQALYQRDDPQFLALYGRRRIGKTYLVNQFFRGKGVYFELSGMKDVPTETQLHNFAVEYADVFNAGEPVPSPSNWLAGFDLLRKRVQARTSNEKMIFF